MWAYSGDGYVTLYWDDNAELSVDRITGDDFEGYKIYKATDTQFTDAGVVTDAFGTATVSYTHLTLPTIDPV